MLCRRLIQEVEGFRSRLRPLGYEAESVPGRLTLTRAKVIDVGPEPALAPTRAGLTTPAATPAPNQGPGGSPASPPPPRMAPPGTGAQPVQRPIEES